MLIEVAMLPKMLATATGKVCIMVDVLRASTTLTVLLDRGAHEIRLARDVEAGLDLAARLPGALLGGERGGLPPAGFDFGNSPVAAATFPVVGRTIVFCTSNGTRALDTLRDATAVLVGGLINARAAARAAVRIATEHGVGIAVVCAGRALGEAFGLDDLYAAGQIVEEIRALTGASEVPLGQDPAAVISGGAVSSEAPALDESALAALRMLAYYGGNHARALADTGNGRALLDIGLGDDVEFCARTNQSETVGLVRFRPEGMWLERLE